MIGLTIRSNSKDMVDIVNTLLALSNNFEAYCAKLLLRFRGEFQRNLYAALVRNEPWARKNWQPLSNAYIKRKSVGNVFYLRTGLLHRSVRPSGSGMKTTLERRGGDLVVDVGRGMIDKKIYPKNKRGITTLDTFFMNEFGTKNDRPPARPVVLPAFWKTLQIMQFDKEFAKIVNAELPGVIS